MRLCRGGCDRELLPAKAWRMFSVEDRRELREVQARDHGRGLCSTCYVRHQRAGTLVDYERTRVDASHVLEEWDHLADPALSIKANAENLAPRLGMKPDALRQIIGRRVRGEVAA